jgi:integrase/recombinase XerD
MGARSARGYLDLVGPFVEHSVRDEADLCGLTAGQVTCFVVAESRRLAPKTVQRLASALRSLLRYWHVYGVIDTPLAAAVPKVAYRSPGLPKGLQPGEVAALLSSCDRSQQAGLRDLAILTLLSRVGLRAGEVANLQLDDIDWRSGEFIVAGKGNRRDRLPLPCDVGQAIADYLRRGRPSDALDRVGTGRRKPAAAASAAHDRRHPAGTERAMGSTQRREHRCAPAAWAAAQPVHDGFADIDG